MAASSSELISYLPSGRISWRLPVRVVIAGLPVLAILGWAYANALLLNPPVFIAPLVNGFFALLCGITAAWVVEKGHSRSVPANTVVALLLALFFMWVRWLVTFRATGVDAALQFVYDPLGVPGMLWERASIEAQIDARAFAPFVHCLVWLAEAFLPALLMVFLARVQARNAYSEAAGAWANKEEGGELYPEYRLADAVLPELVADGVPALLRMPRADQMHSSVAASEWSTLKITGHKLEADPLARWLDIELLNHRRDTEGKVKVNSTDLVKAWVLSPDDYAAVMEYFRGEARNPPLEDLVAEDVQPTPSALEPAVEAMQEDDFARAIHLATPYRQHPDRLVQADALRLCALSQSNMAQWALAFADFHELFELEPTPHNALQLATTSVMAGELQRGQAWFERADMLNRETGEMPAGRLRTAFLSALEQAGEAASCLPHLEWLARAYRALSVSDSHVVWSHGLPFISEFLEKSLPLLRAALPEADIRAWYLAMRDDLDAEGQATIDAFIVASVASA